MRSGPCLIAIAVSFCMLGACSKPATQASGVAGAAAATGNACDRKLLSVADVGDLLQEPITGTAPLKGDPQTCYFVTATTQSRGGPEIMVSLRPGLGRVTLKTWLDGKMGTTATKIGGVGDDAVWVSELKELDAQKNDLLCVVSVSGAGHNDGIQQKLSDLCNKIYAHVAT